MLPETSTTFLVDLADPHNTRTWRLFAARYRPLFVAYARRRGLQEADAQDVAQEILLAVAQSHQAGGYDRSRGRFRNWLRGIAAHKTLDAERRLAQRAMQPKDGFRTGFLAQVPDSRQDELERLFEEEWRKFVWARCVRTMRRELDDRTCRAFTLYVCQGMDPERVAEAVGMSRECVYGAKSRVLKRMREVEAELERTA